MWRAGHDVCTAPASVGRREDSTGDFLIGLPLVREDSRAELDPILKRGDRVHLMREAEIARWLDPQRFLRLRRAQDDGDELELEYEANDGITLERAIRE